MFQTSRQASWWLALVCWVSLISSISCVSQAALHFATSSAGPYNRLGTLHLAAIDDDMRSQLSVDGVTTAHINLMRQLSHDENNRLYISTSSDPRDKTNSITTSISLCRIVHSGFAMNLTVSLDATDSIAGLYAHTKVELCNEAATHALSLEEVDEQPLRVRVITNYCEHGTQPDADRYLAKIEREQMEKEMKGDERGFFAKYWMYIVPGVIIYFVMTSVQQPEGGGGRGG